MDFIKFVLLPICIMFFSIYGLASLDAQAAQTKPAKNTLDAYAPFEDLIQITASDATEYDPPLRGCIVEVAGDLVVSPIKSASDVTITVTAGQMIPAIITHVKAATTATVICGR